MTTRPTAEAAIRRQRPSRPPGIRRRFLPPQHGAWAMLAVPYLTGLLTLGYRWPDLPLAGAWLTGYLLSYYFFQVLKSRRPERYRTQVVVYAAVAAPLAGLVLAARPAVSWYAPVYAVLLTVNAWYAIRRRERALVNDLVSVLQSCLLIPVVATIAGRPPQAAIGTFLLCLGYFTGTVFYVKTMIRERANPTYRRWSIGCHLAALATVGWLGIAAAGLFAWLLARAAILPGRGWSPKRTGLVEILNCALLVVCALLI